MSFVRHFVSKTLPQSITFAGIANLVFFCCFFHLILFFFLKLDKLIKMKAEQKEKKRERGGKINKHHN